MVISEIRIRNFRSIIKTEIALNEFSMFVGLNDVGKSNVLKALNLFFNGETDYGKSFNFNDDYCKYAPSRVRKAEEITIEIVFLPPSTYTGAKPTRVVKVWRHYGLHYSDTGFVDGKKFPQASRIKTWIQNVKYAYVPAIRDSNYFQRLLVDLHDSLAVTIERELRDAGDEFIGKIKNNTESMILEINKRLNIDSQIKLPSNLQSLFSTLDFSTRQGEFQVSLSSRGDGVKTRHVPVILKFIADQLNIHRRRGAANVNMIWGYEEPENNLEMLGAFSLAKQFLEYSNQIQILLTTHSPGFYTLKEDSPSRINLFKVQKQNNQNAIISEIKSYSDLNEDMGIMPLVSPYIKEKVEEISKLQNDIASYSEQLSRFTKHTFFVEGDDEVRIFNKVISTGKNDDKIVVSKDGFGCSGVKSHMMAWAWVSGSTSLKAVGIFDNDESGNSELKKLRDEPQYKDAENKLRVKAANYKVPDHLRNIKSKINLFPIELEEMYLPIAWTIAQTNGWLETRPVQEIASFVKLDSATQTLNDKIASLGFSSDELMYVTYKIPDQHKDKMSKLFEKMDDAQFMLHCKPIYDFLTDNFISFLLK